MIPNHPQFLAAVADRTKVRLRFYSLPDSGVVDHVCAPLDYGPGGQVEDGLNRYWLWDYAAVPNPTLVGLAPQQIVDLQVLGETFDPAEFTVTPWTWSVPRTWGSPG